MRRGQGQGRASPSLGINDEPGRPASLLRVECAYGCRAGIAVQALAQRNSNSGRPERRSRLRLRWAVEPRLALAAVPGHVSGARNFSAKKTGREWR